MSRFIRIEGHVGGLADGAYDPIEGQTYQSALNLDVYRNRKTLKPIMPELVEITLPSPANTTNVNFKNYLKGSDGNHYFLGSATISGVASIILYRTSSLVASPSWTQLYAVNGSNTYAGMAEYNNGIVFANGDDLISVDMTSTAASTLGSLPSGTDQFGDIIYHRGLSRIYYVHGASASTLNKVGYYSTADSMNNTKLTIAANEYITNLEEHDIFVLVGVRPKGNSTRSYIGVWNGSGLTLASIIQIGDVGLQAFRNKAGMLYVHTTVFGSSSDEKKNRFYKLPISGSPRLVHEVVGGGGSEVNPNAISLISNQFFTVIDGESATYAGIYSIHAEAGYEEFPTKFRYPPTGTNHTFKCVKDVGELMVVLTTDVTSGTTFRAFFTGATGAQTISNNGVYESNIFPLNGGLKGKIKNIFINHLAIPTSCGFTAYIKQMGHYPFDGSVETPEDYQALDTAQGTGGSTGKTQSTNNAMYTQIMNHPKFRDARYGQLKILWDENLTTNAMTLVWPVIIEVE